MTEPEGETNAAWADLDAPDVKVIYEQFLSGKRAEMHAAGQNMLPCRKAPPAKPPDGRAQQSEALPQGSTNPGKTAEKKL